MAMAGSWQPSSGDQRKVEAMPPEPSGLKTATGPRRARNGAVYS
jgi:hypothetical protein